MHLAFVRKQASMQQVMTISVSEQVVISLPVHYTWSVEIEDPAGILNPAQPGVHVSADLSEAACQFTVTAAGTAGLTFTGRPITASGHVRSYIVVQRSYAIVAQ